MKDRIEISVDRGVADVRLVRGDKMNALDNKMFEAIIEAGEVLRGDPGIRVVVLSGEGRAFSAGLDMSNFAAMADAGNESDKKSGSKPVRSTLAERTHGIANRPHALRQRSRTSAPFARAAAAPVRRISSTSSGRDS